MMIALKWIASARRDDKTNDAGSKQTAPVTVQTKTVGQKMLRNRRSVEVGTTVPGRPKSPTGLTFRD